MLKLGWPQRELSPVKSGSPGSSVKDHKWRLWYHCTLFPHWSTLSSDFSHHFENTLGSWSAWSLVCCRQKNGCHCRKSKKGLLNVDLDVNSQESGEETSRFRAQWAKRLTAVECRKWLKLQKKNPTYLAVPLLLHVPHKNLSNPPTK